MPTIKVFWNKGSEWIIYIHDSTIKILSSSSSYKVYVVMNQILVGYSSIFMGEVITSQIIYGFVQKADFEGWSWFNINNLGLALGMALRLYSSVAERLKLKVKKC